MSPVGTPVARIHLEARTDLCICKKLYGCGGILAADLMCPEHGLGAEAVAIHTHALQVDRISVGTLHL